MSNPSQLRGASFARSLQWAATIGGTLVGACVLLGWAWNIPSAMTVVPGLTPIAPNTALGLFLAGVALGLLSPGVSSWLARAVGQLCAWGLILIGAATIVEYGLPRDLGVQDMLFRWMEWASRVQLPLSAASTAFCFVLLGGSLLLLGRRAAPRAFWVDTACTLVLLVALFEFNGRLHGALADRLFSVIAHPEGMGLHTSLVLMLLALGVLCTRPERGLMGQLTRDTLGGFLARRLVPVSILGPTLVGVALELFHREGIFSLPTKSALFSTVMSLGGVAIVFLSAQALNRIDAERRQANASLAASEERFRGLLETAPEAVITVDASGRVRFVNAQAEHLFGAPREELLGQEVEQLVPGLLQQMPVPPTAPPNAAPQAHRTAPGVRLRARHKSGDAPPVDVTLSPFVTPEGMTVTAIIRDVTDTERYLETLRLARSEAEQERALLEAVVEHAPVGILFLDPSRAEVRLNSTLQAMMGINSLPSDRMQYLRWLRARLRHTDGRMVSAEELPSTRALEGHEVPPERYYYVRPQERLPALASAAPVRGPSGEIRGAIVCIQDISVQEELERLREEYVGLISHDLRTPLQNILLRGQQMLGSLRKKELAAETVMAEALLRNTRWMSRMVEELLEGSRLESGQVELHREPLELGHFIEEVIERDVPPDARERLRLEVAVPVPPVPVDVPRLERVLVNLLTNALKYSAPGTPVVVRLEREDGQVRVSVKDQGKGLSPEEAERLFTKYYRTHEGRRAEGVGLGLYITRLIIEAHGGEIHVESTQGQGSTFHFTLPLTIPAREEERQGPFPPGGGAPR